MKNTTILKKFDTQPNAGTYSMSEYNFLFGSKMIDIEDDIIINNAIINYYQSNLASNYGFQYYNVDIYQESVFNLDLFSIKKDKHKYKLYNQDHNSLKNNTKWQFDINTKEILTEYIFAKIKNARAFKAIKQEYFLNNKINDNIYNYINYNIIHRYKIEKINFYLLYKELLNNDNQYSNDILKLKPIYSNIAFTDGFLVTDITIKKPSNNVNNLTMIFNQTNNSDLFTYYYYFDIIFKKI